MARGGGSKSVQAGVGQATCQVLLAGRSKTTVRFLGWSFDLEFVFRQREGNAKCRSLERVASWASNFKIKCNIFKATVQGALLSAYALSQAMAEASQRMSFFRWKRAKTDRRDGSSMTRRNWDSELKERQISKNEAHRKSELCQLQRKSEFAVSKRMAEQIQKDDLSHQQVLMATFEQKRLNKYLCVTSEGKPIVYATPRAKQFREDIKSLKEIDEGDDLVRELHEDFRKLFRACRRFPHT